MEKSRKSAYEGTHSEMLMQHYEDSLVTRKTGEINALELKGGKQAVWHRNLPPSIHTDKRHD